MTGETAARARELIQEGTRQAETLDHKLTRFRVFRLRKNTLLAKCRTCFAEIAVSPAPNGGQLPIGGEAARLRCDGEKGKEQRKNRLKALRDGFYEPEDD